ncbi:hypothetical protein HDU85_001766 [Gaertneriomyces sp. JEL0708]|nr:hypothetical protein HDU85_001766 [Gaertneriomyces sp. JEL0708]
MRSDPSIRRDSFGQRFASATEYPGLFIRTVAVQTYDTSIQNLRLVEELLLWTRCEALSLRKALDFESDAADEQALEQWSSYWKSRLDFVSKKGDQKIMSLRGATRSKLDSSLARLSTFSREHAVITYNLRADHASKVKELHSLSTAIKKDIRSTADNVARLRGEVARNGVLIRRFKSEKHEMQTPDVGVTRWNDPTKVQDLQKQLRMREDMINSLRKRIREVQEQKTRNGAPTPRPTTGLVDTASVVSGRSSTMQRHRGVRTPGIPGTVYDRGVDSLPEQPALSEISLAHHQSEDREPLQNKRLPGLHPLMLKDPSILQMQYELQVEKLESYHKKCIDSYTLETEAMLGDLTKKYEDLLATFQTLSQSSSVSQCNHKARSLITDLFPRGNADKAVKDAGIQCALDPF